MGILFRLIPVLLLMFGAQTYAGETDKSIALQLPWKHQFQFAGYYAALAKGYYHDAGLEVEIREGGDGRFATEDVRKGQAQYGVGGD